MKKLDQDKMHATMRSIYRFSEFKDMDAPDVLIDTERDILRRHFGELTAEEIVHILANFSDYQKEQVTQTVLENEKMAGNVTRYLAELN